MTTESVKTAKATNPERIKIVRKVIEQTCGPSVDPVEWRQNMFNFNKLLKQYPDLEFWDNCFQPWSRPLPIHVYFGVKGKSYIKEAYDKFIIEKQTKEKHNIETKEMLDEFSRKVKPKSLMEFLKENHETQK